MSRMAKVAAVALGTSAVMLSGAGLATADSGSSGSAAQSPGIVSGDVLQIPLDVPLNICGNSIDVIGLLNPVFGNVCADVDDHHGHHNSGGYGR
ncbi:membrane protein [Streptomyces ruber]|uniref:Membrane protein n=2 Tax=Streptomyces TaxID=1883 RepID=A0A918BAZ8_9ACTN|nr:chaplin [Streptomyces ruber]GGQ55338.1 membrane protein [Streptomyces ruber]